MQKTKIGNMCFCLFFLAGLSVYCSSPAESNGIEETPNQRPIVTSVSGATQVVTGVEYDYEAVGYDPDGDTVRYHFGTWPEGRYDDAYTNWGYTDFLENNKPGNMKITWKDIGECYLCVHVVDNKGIDSQPHTIITIQVSQKD